MLTISCTTYFCHIYSPDVKAELEESEKCSRRHQNRTGAEGENPALNRVDLISRTIKTLEKMNRENEERKVLLEGMSAQGTDDIAAARQAIKDDRVSSRLLYVS